MLEEIIVEEVGEKFVIVQERIEWIKIVFILLIMVFIMNIGYYAFLLYLINY